MSSFFSNIEVFPSLLHGDLWSGNVGQVGNTPVVFDPASFYGHHEYDLAIGKMFGGFGGEFHKYDSHTIYRVNPGILRLILLNNTL